MSAIKTIYIIPDYLHINDTLELCDRYGTCFEYNDFFVPNLLDDKTALADRIRFYRNLKRPSGVDTLHGVFFDICVNSSDEQIAQISQKRMLSSMEIASELNCKGVVFHTNLIPGFEPDFYLDSWLQRNGEFYSDLSRKFSGIDIYVENMFDMKPDMLARLAKSNGDIGVCFDVAHSHIHKDKTMEYWINSLSPYIKHLHVNDNCGQNDDHLAVGDGTIDWEKFFELINSKITRDISMLIEVSSIEKQIKSLEYLKEGGWI